MPVTINGSAGVTTNTGAVYDGIQRATPKSATGTSVDFTGIPSWVKRITLIWEGVSTNGNSSPLVQLGDSGGFEITGYLGTGSLTVSTVASSNFTTGFGERSQDAAAVRHGLWTITNTSGNVWVCSGALGRSDGGATSVTGGSKTLSDVLTQIRITTVNGTDSYDAGNFNILFE
jgi:hypothetical protein